MGAGVQTTALLVVQPADTWDAVVFADPGDEHPDTYAYIEKYLKPYCAEHGLPWHTLKQPSTLRQYMLETGRIPNIRDKWCTTMWKKRPIRYWCRDHLAATRDDPVTMDIGISTDEPHRARMHADDPSYVRRAWPLIELGMSRSDCKAAIKRHGWPEPVKSGCEFCFYRPASVFADLHGRRPEIFRDLIAVEKKNGRYKFKQKLDLEQMGLQLDRGGLMAFAPEAPAGCSEGFCGV